MDKNDIRIVDVRRQLERGGPHIEIIVGEKHYRVFMDGHVEGFPEGSLVLNRMLPEFNRQHALVEKAISNFYESMISFPENDNGN